MSDVDERVEQQIAPTNSVDWVRATALPAPGARTADEWEPLGPVTLLAGDFIQIAPRRPGRQTLLVVNTGGNAALMARKKDGNAPKRYMTLAPSGALSIDTEATVYAYSASGTTLELLETMWAAPELHAGTTHNLFAMSPDGLRP